MSELSYRFGPFRVDRTSYRLVRGDETVNLTPKLLDLLIHLLEHAGDLVTKEALLEALWPDANVTDNALTQAVSELRQVLGDDPAAPRFIKTIARRGYRMVAAVERVDEPPPQQAARHPIEPHDVPSKTIAVLDFVNVTGEADDGWLASGIAETVSADLRSLGEFRIVDRRRVTDAVRRTDGSLQALAADLRSRFIVVGSYQRSGHRVRITARVVDVVSGEAVADAKVDGPLETIFELQDQIVGQFAADMGLSTRRTAGARETPSLEAYRAFTEGWLRLESLDTREMERAVEDFERAVALDKRYAPAYTGLASAEFALYESTRSENEPAEPLLHRAIEHARHAVSLEEGLAEAHATLALLLVSARQTSEAELEARRAVALEPSNWRHLFRLGHASWGEARLQAAAATLDLYPDFAFAHFQIAMVHVARGRLSQAETVLRQGAAVQDRQRERRERFPALGLHWLLALTRLADDDTAEALVELDRELLVADPHRLYGREFAMNALHSRGVALLRAHRADEAIAALRRALELYPLHAQTHLALASAYRSLGNEDAGRAALAKVDEALQTLTRCRPFEGAIVRALQLAGRGQIDDAGQLVRQELAEAPPGFAGWTLPVEPLLAHVRNHQAFAGVLRLLADRAR